ncbi:MAG TPA: glycosyltransferase family 10 [Rhabdochlamydiaceae bacterium]|nr:glycosyltransferase family 10 [Rhabdochlamydiaceae bacterium]
MPPNDQTNVQNGCLSAVYKALQEKNIRLFETDLKNEKDYFDLTYVIVWNKTACPKKELFKKFPKKKLLLFMWEPPVFLKVKPAYYEGFKRVYTWNDDLVDNIKFFKFYYPVLQPMLQNLPSFEEKKLVTQMSSNKKSKHSKELYKAREAVIQFFEDKDDFEFYGPAWESKEYKNYRGTVDNKLDTLKNYRFNVCYENMRDVKGYITEKIFDSFAAGSVPIYWGASNVTDYIPKNCFIDRRDFKDFAEVYEYIRTMDKATYDAYLKNIQEYLQSDKAKLFSQEMFSVIFLEAIRFP